MVEVKERGAKACHVRSKEEHNRDRWRSALSRPPCGITHSIASISNKQNKQTPWPLVRERTIPTE
jgi:hypothetical protein